jgi:hypothetical protein
MIAEPWANAGQRVVVLASAGVTDNNLAALGMRRASDTGLGSNELGLDGEHYHFSAKPKSGSWVNVNSATDIDMQVTSLPHRKR